jgi:tetratricopeptide (TPR) repeat protein
MMASLHYYHYLNNQKEARNLAEKAIQLDSKWGYAHYKLGGIICDLSRQEKDEITKQKMLIRSLDEFKKAGDLDPKLREGTLPLVHIHTALKDYRAALRHLDIFIQAEKKRNATAFEMDNLKGWRAQLTKQIK